MKRFTQALVDFLQRDDGPTSVEYAVMLSLIIVMCITALTAMGANASQIFNSVSNVIRSAGS